MKGLAPGRPGVWLLPLLAALAGCGAGGAHRPPALGQGASFEALYRQNCSGCHGREGRLGPAPPLNDPLFLALVPDAELLRVVTEGRPGTPMPAFAEDRGGPLTDDQVRVLARGIKARWAEAGEAPEGAPPYSAGQGLGDKDRGLAVFARACAGCHGSDGRKDGMEVRDPAFLELTSDQALRRIVITGRPDLDMPDYAGKARRGPDYQPLTAAEVADLVALLGYWRQGGTADGK